MHIYVSVSVVGIQEHCGLVQVSFCGIKNFKRKLFVFSFIFLWKSCSFQFNDWIKAHSLQREQTAGNRRLFWGAFAIAISTAIHKMQLFITRTHFSMYTHLQCHRYIFTKILVLLFCSLKMYINIYTFPNRCISP